MVSVLIQNVDMLVCLQAQEPIQPLQHFATFHFALSNFQFCYHIIIAVIIYHCAVCITCIIDNCTELTCTYFVHLLFKFYAIVAEHGKTN